MSKSDAFETTLLEYLFEATAIPSLTTTLYLALHTADPGEAGTQATSEAAYTGYARKALTRDAIGTNFTVAGGVVTLVGNQDFGAHTGGVTTSLTHWSIGVGASGATAMWYYGALATPIAMAAGVIPRVNGSQTIVTEA